MDKSIGNGKTIMAFGTFDRLHPGHVFFLRQAKKLGGTLVVVIARDSSVRALKHHTPQQSQSRRVAALQRLKIADAVVLGDAKLGSYGVVKKFRPAVIALGYDQHMFERNIRKSLPRLRLGYRPAFRRIGAYLRRKYKSSILRRR